jgi:hypothetical protein
VRVRLRNALLVAALMATAAYLAWQSSSYWSGDYPVEAGPAIDSLIHGRLGDFLAERPLMGPLSLVLRAPFAALSLITGGGGKIDQYDAAYRLGVFPCALFGGAIGSRCSQSPSGLVVVRWSSTARSSCARSTRSP